MKFHEKLRKRVQQLGLNKSRAARDVGLPESTISSYLSKFDSLPRIDIALKIAKAINVPLEWLADDTQDWPPPAATASVLSNDELVAEVGRRSSAIALAMAVKLQAASETDWVAAVRELISIKPPKKPDARLEKMMALPGQIAVLESEIDPFNPWVDYDLKRFSKLSFPVTVADLLRLPRELYVRPGYAQMAQLAGVWNLPEEPRDFALKLLSEGIEWELREGPSLAKIRAERDLRPRSKHSKT